MESFNCHLLILFSYNYSFWAHSACLISWGRPPMLWLLCQPLHQMSYMEPGATNEPVRCRASSFRLELLLASSMYHLPRTTSWLSNITGPRRSWKESVLNFFYSSHLLPLVWRMLLLVLSTTTMSGCGVTILQSKCICIYLIDCIIEMISKQVDFDPCFI